MCSTLAMGDTHYITYTKTGPVCVSVSVPVPTVYCGVLCVCRRAIDADKDETTRTSGHRDACPPCSRVSHQRRPRWLEASGHRQCFLFDRPDGMQYACFQAAENAQHVESPCNDVHAIQLPRCNLAHCILRPTLARSPNGRQGTGHRSGRCGYLRSASPTGRKYQRS